MRYKCLSMFVCLLTVNNNNNIIIVFEIDVSYKKVKSMENIILHQKKKCSCHFCSFNLNIKIKTFFKFMQLQRYDGNYSMKDLGCR